jgi:hypothetical protein
MNKDCKFKYGDVIEVSDVENKDRWTEKIFISYEPLHTHPFVVMDKDSNRMFDGGRVTSWKYARYYLEPKPDLKVDDKVWVRYKDSQTGHWEPRHFCRWSSINNENIICFQSGQTSHTTDSIAEWSYWSITDPNK